jgi:nucleotide-binding universal stress UspA family protein
MKQEVKMSGIVCAIRGGPASRPTIERSIQLAADTGLTLYFLYVVSLDFLSHTTLSRTHLISQEMAEMGEFILLNAETGAQAQGVTTARVIRHGEVGDEIARLCSEIRADYVVLGAPKGQQESDVFTHEKLSTLVEEIKRGSQAEIVLAAGD